MNNRAAIFAHYIQCLSLTVMVMMSLMNTSIDTYMAVMSTAWGYTFEIFFADCCLYSCESKDLCGQFRSSVSKNSSQSRSFHSSIAASLIVVYSSGTGAVPTGN